MKDFRNRVAAITGAGSGIGRALALDLANRQCHLSLSDINESTVHEVAELARRCGVTVTDQQVDVSDRDAVHEWAAKSAADHGQVNVIVNNAGVALGATVEDMTYVDMEWLMGINFWGVIHGTKAFLPHLKSSGEGHVVNISSVFGLMGIPTQSAYNAAKFAVRGFTESLRIELDLERCGVSCTTVHPGGIKTNIARNARFDERSIERLGQDPSRVIQASERAFLTSPEKAARVILGAVEQNKRRVMVGPDAQLFKMLSLMPPALYQRLIALGTRIHL